MRIDIKYFADKKASREKLVMLTAYDYSTARILDEAGIPLLLVGDSLGMVMLGYDSTIPVTIDDMLHHTRAVSRAARRAMVITDMPFLSYQVSTAEALRNAGRLVQQGGAQAVKLEGGVNVASTIQAIVSAGIPVMAHLGLTPQYVHQLGGYHVQGKSLEVAKRLYQDSLSVQQSGAFALVLETVPESLAAFITSHLSIPTIGIGAGAGCDGQVQVVNDLLGSFYRFFPQTCRALCKPGQNHNPGRQTLSAGCNHRPISNRR
jgi:3-methyl-2-oxobutanoate hydroxymethyltransferase